MYYLEKTEFIESLYYIYFSTYSEDKKRHLLKEIFFEYKKFGVVNSYFELIYEELITGHFCGTMDEHFLLANNGKILSLAKLLSSKILVHRFAKNDYVEKILLVENKRCKQCGNEDKSHFFNYVTSFKEDCCYCKKCLSFGISNNITYSFSINFKNNISYSQLTFPAIKLSAEQQKAADMLVKNVECKKDTLIWAVCGAGKTEIIYEVLYKSLKNNEKICLAIPRKDVVKELAIRLKRDFNIPITVLHGDEKNVENSNLYIMTTHQLVNYYNYFDLIIVDEVDAFPYSGDSVLEYGALKAKTKDAPLFFLSATPSKEIQKFVKDIYKIPIRYHGYLLPEPILKINKNIDINKIPFELSEFINRVQNNRRRALIFVPTIKIGSDLYDTLKTDIASIAYVNSTDELRDNKIAMFRNWDIQFLITTTILERGVTFDYLDIFVYNADHNNFSQAALIQIAGRAGRKSYDYTGEVVFLSGEKKENVTKAKKEIITMNELAKYRKLNRS